MDFCQLAKTGISCQFFVKARGVTQTFEKQGNTCSIQVFRIQEPSFRYQRLCFGADFSHSAAEQIRAVHSDSRAQRWRCFLPPVSRWSAHLSASEQKNQSKPRDMECLPCCLPPAGAVWPHQGGDSELEPCSCLVARFCVRGGEERE